MLELGTTTLWKREEPSPSQSHKQAICFFIGGYASLENLLALQRHSVPLSKVSNPNAPFCHLFNTCLQNVLEPACSPLSQTSDQFKMFDKTMKLLSKEHMLKCSIFSTKSLKRRGNKLVLKFKDEVSCKIQDSVLQERVSSKQTHSSSTLDSTFKASCKNLAANQFLPHSPMKN